MDHAQIKARLLALDEYEMAILRNSRDGLDDPEAEDRALFKIMEARSRLRAALATDKEESYEELEAQLREIAALWSPHSPAGYNSVLTGAADALADLRKRLKKVIETLSSKED